MDIFSLQIQKYVIYMASEILCCSWVQKLCDVHGLSNFVMFMGSESLWCSLWGSEILLCSQTQKFYDIHGFRNFVMFMGSDISEILQTWEYVMSMNYQCNGHIYIAYKSQLEWSWHSSEWNVFVINVMCLFVGSGWHC